MHYAGQDLTWDISSQDICLGDYPGVTDAWMEVVASQGQSLLSVDLSCSDVTDSGFNLLKDCSSMQSLACDYCDKISEHGLKTLSGQCYADSTTAEFAVSCMILFCQPSIVLEILFLFLCHNNLLTL